MKVCNHLWVSVLLSIILGLSGCGSQGTHVTPEENADMASESAREEDTDKIPEDIPEELTCEIKFMLDRDAVLNDEHLFNERFTDLFDIEDDPRQIEVIYIDTKDRTYGNEGWINRIRWKSGKKKAERVYKKRYHVSGNDVSGALAEASADGFDPRDDRYSPQIDWTYSGMELSFSHEVSGKYGDHSDLTQFSLQDALIFLKEGMPEEEIDWKEEGWGTDNLESAQMAGPLTFLRAKGEWEGFEVKAEIWPVPTDDAGNPGTDTEYICELSVEIEDFESAESLREDLMAYLDENGVLLREDALKTQMILDAYLN